MPRGQEICSNCGLSVREALRRSEKPTDEQPPVELYEIQQRLEPDQKFFIGAFFFGAICAGIAQAWISMLTLIVTGLMMTPAFSQWWQRQRGQHLGLPLRVVTGVLGTWLAVWCWSL